MKIISHVDAARAQAEATLSRIYEAAKGRDLTAATAYILNNRTDIWLHRFRTEDPTMTATKNTVRRLAAISQPVLITGPSGTGKELLARALHGARHDSLFFHINCAGMPEGLIESELFGHTSGSFTGAVRDYRGILRAADGGTVFLDEIGEAPLHLQAKLLTALQPDDKGLFTVRPIGATTSEKVSFRLVAATKVDLFEAVQANRFREDLYGRLMAHEVTTTSLAQRPLDIPLILRFLDYTPSPEDYETLDTPYWASRLALFNVRALQAYVARQRLTTSPDTTPIPT